MCVLASVCSGQRGDLDLKSAAHIERGKHEGRMEPLANIDRMVDHVSSIQRVNVNGCQSLAILSMLSVLDNCAVFFFPL